MSKNNKKNRPQLESQEQPIINYGDESKLDSAPKKLSLDDIKLPKVNVQIQNENFDEVEAEQVGEEIEDSREIQLEIELEEVKRNYQKLFTRYHDLQQKHQALEEKCNAISAQPQPKVEVDASVANELNEIKIIINGMYHEFQNEASGRNRAREVHDIIYLTGEFGLINKFRKAFSFLR